MAQHAITLWVESEDDPANVDWEFYLPKEFKLEHAQIRTFPWHEVYHEITWWITRPLTMEEWSRLDDEECEVLIKIVGEHDFMGSAGPIPELPEE